MNFKLSKILVFVLAVFLIGACSSGIAVEIGGAAPDFTLKDASGKAVKLSEFKGKVIILDFFASWCPPCRKEIPDFITLQNSYAGAGSFTMVGVSLVSKEETVDFISKTGINYPVLVDTGSAGDAYGPIRSIPTTFVIGKDFKISKVYIGYRSKDVFEKDIVELMR